MGATTEQSGDRRFALLLAVGQYADPALNRLRSPAADAVALRDLLADPEIGGFAVTSVFDERAQAMRLAVEEFLSDRRPDDVVLVYLSCHGLVDLRRRLYFAARDTLKDRLASSGVEAHWLLDQLEDCRARRQVVVLDCCFSGAFARGAKGDSDLGLGERLMGQGRGRVVLTASRGTEYSFEGDPVDDEAPRGSVFTSALVGGITSGEADADGDGLITVDEAYSYAFEKIRESGGQQTPQRWLYGAEGSILLARAPVEVGSTTHVGPVASSSGGEVGMKAAPDGDASPPEPSGPRPAPVRRWRPWLLGGVAAAGLVAAGVLVGTLVDGDGGGDGGGDEASSSGTSPADPGGGSATASGQLEVAAPWRLIVRGVGEGCDVTVTDTEGEEYRVEDVYGAESFHMHVSGTVTWHASHPDCEVIQQPGAAEQALPIQTKSGTGDTPAFSAPRSVTVEVLDFSGNSSCAIDLRSIEDGHLIDYGTTESADVAVVLETFGESPVYVADSYCGYRITDSS